MNHCQKPRGTADYYGINLNQMEQLEKILVDLVSPAGYCKVITPTFEEKRLFVRSLGEASDLVNKEFFHLVTKNEHEYVLRPENTASVMRMVASDKLLFKQPLPLRFFYYAPMFRYERPQAGRLREFFQFGIELVGSKSVNDDLEILLLIDQLIKHFNLTNYVTLKLNYLGDLSTKKQWNAALTAHFQANKHELSSLNQARIERNPIRILDDKADMNITCVRNAPQISAFLDSFNQAQICQIQSQLKELQIPYVWSPELVRGFDYYTGLVFEVIFNGPALKGQNTLLGGGRYHKILKELGSDDYECIGFGLGIERFLIALKAINYEWQLAAPNYVYLATLTNPDACLWKLINALRQKKQFLITNWQTQKLAKHFKCASHYLANYVLIYGPSEQASQTIIFKVHQHNFSQIINLNHPQQACDAIIQLVKQCK